MAKIDWMDGVGDMEEYRERNDASLESTEVEQHKDDEDETIPEIMEIPEKINAEEWNDSKEVSKEELKEELKEESLKEETSKDRNAANTDEKEAGDEASETLIQNLKNELALARADLYNYRQRVERDRVRKMKLMVEDRVSEFLPVVDNLDRALQVPEDGSVKDVLMGVRMVQRQFLSVLESLGITAVPTEGCRFDPRSHEAVETELVDDPEQDGMVLQELTRGYATPDRVLRPAHVRVGKLRDVDEEENPDRE